LLNYETLQKHDLKEMHKVYDQWPDIAKKCYKSNLNSVDFKDISNIVFAGMGGSGAIGDIFSSILSKSEIHVNVVKGYLLPKTVNKNTLVVITSVSGNTDETLTVIKSAEKLDANIISFSDNGIIKEFCVKNNIEHREIKMIHSPRASFTAFLYSMLKVLDQILPIKNNDVFESIDNLQKLKTRISSKNITKNNPSLELAEWITDIPLIYYPFGLQSAAIRFKNSLQENCKLHVMTEDIIEACHNGVVSWERKSNIKPILIEGKDDYIKTRERWEILKEVLEQNQVEYKEIFSIEGNILTKTMNLIYLFDYSTIYKSVIDKIDPSPIKSIDFIKSRLGTNEI